MNKQNYFIMNKKDFIANYEAPHVEVIEVEIEKGFATSNTEGFGDWQ